MLQQTISLLGVIFFVLLACLLSGELPLSVISMNDDDSDDENMMMMLMLLSQVPKESRFLLQQPVCVLCDVVHRPFATLRDVNIDKVGWRPFEKDVVNSEV